MRILHMAYMRTVLFALLCVLCCSTTWAQKTDDWTRDTTFIFGGYGINNYVPYDHDTLHFSVVQNYNGSESMAYLNTVHNPADYSGWWQWNHDTAFFHAAGRYGLKMIYAPGFIADIGTLLTVTENYFGHRNVSWIHLQRFDYPDTVWSSHPGTEYISMLNTWIFGIRVPAVMSRSDTMIARQSKAVDEALYMPYSGIFSSIGGDTAELRKSWDITLTLQADSVDNPLINDTAAIAYADLYERDTTGQSICGCNFYRKFKTAEVRKTDYLDSAILIPNSSYRDIPFTFQFPITSDTISRAVVIAGDTVLRSGQILQPYVPSPVNRGDGRQDSTCPDYCHALFDSLKAVGYFHAGDTILPHAVNGSDLYANIGLTRIVQTTFLKSAVSPHLYTLVRNGAYDTQINSVVSSVKSDSMLDTALVRFGIIDEPLLVKYAGYRELARKIQSRQEAIGDTRPLWANPVGDHASFRLASGDLDSLGPRRVVSELAEQEYGIGGPIPIAYANPDSMSITASDTSYRLMHLDTIAGADTTWTRFIMGNSGPDYNHYTTVDQGVWAGKIIEIGDAIATARYHFSAQNAPSVPVYYVAQVHGALGDGNTWAHGWRPTTPEEEILQVWLAASMGVEGVLFSDFQFQGNEFGLMHFNSRDSLGWADSTLGPPERGETFYDRYWNAEYDVVYTGHPNDRGKGIHIPKTWAGFGSRRRAIEEVTGVFWNRILPVYRKLRHDPSRLSMSDSGVSFASLPLIDSAVAQRAVQYLDSSGFSASGSYDARSLTYMDFAVFQPGAYMPSEAADGTQWFEVINRRCWPIDFHHYSSSLARRLDTVAGTLAANRHDTVGLGNIDVRRPAVWLKNSSPVMADSMLVTKLSDTTWQRRVAIGDRLDLDWLKPGRGEMYRVTPIPSGISRYGAAFNNAVRAENPSTDAAQSDRVVVYERDSLIYMRALDTNGVWSTERMLTDGTTLVAQLENGDRRYYDLNPAVAMLRGGNSALVVWERRDSSNHTTTVQALRYPVLPTATRLNDAGWETDVQRYTLSKIYGRARSWQELNPAIVSIDLNGGLDGGYLIAWSSQDSGVDLCALRDRGGASLSPVAGEDTAHLYGIRADSTEVGFGVAKVALLPTLAYVNNTAYLLPKITNAAMLDGGGPDIQAQAWNIVHLAYEQQTSSLGDKIMYNRIGVQFRQSAPIALGASPTEHVSQGLPGCSFIHPSIATDSVRVGVAFELTGTRNAIGLRFRDTLRTGDTLRSIHAWQTPLYSWGGALGMTVPSMTAGHDYRWPSLSEFPQIVADSTRTVLDGGVAWEWDDAPDGRSSPLLIYRYGNVAVDTIDGTGRYPTMMLAPNRRTAPFLASGVLLRGSDSDASAGTSIYMNAATYYPVRLVNTPSAQSSIFTAGQQSKSIYSQFRIGPTSSSRWHFLYCNDGEGHGASITAGLHISAGPIVISPVDTLWWHPIDPEPRTVPKLPPIFFAAPRVGATRIDNLTAAADVARTSDFLAGMSPVPIVRTILGSDSLVAWLDEFPYDSTMHSSSDFKILIELVRSSDSVVLWRGDTLSSRSIGSGYVEDLVDVPVDTAASPGTPVFIRLRAVATRGLDSFDIASGFHFEDSIATGYMKMTHRAVSVPGKRSSLSVMVMPNPAHDNARIHLHTAVTGSIRVEVYDLAGNPIDALPVQSIDRAGEYLFDLDTSLLRNGLYTIRASVGSERAVTKLTVLR